MELIKAQKGTQDILPGQSENWQVVEDVMRSEAALHGFGEIRTPVFEDTRLFQRSVGETTDVVQKEMYTFQDKGGRSITLRPEGTAGVVRALLEHALYNNGLPVKLHYFTTCYRYENTQAGRLREFHQFGVEMFGSNSPSADAEVIGLAKSVFDRLGIKNLRLEINSIGCPTCRAEFHKALKAYFTQYKDQLCETCQGRLERNPMRILDCKSPICSKIAEGAPKILDYLCDDCKEHFAAVQKYLQIAGIPYEIDPGIVRGLDYYTRTVFEFVSEEIGAQGTVLGGGRYDGLIEEIGGPSTPAVGFAAGLERLLLLMEKSGASFPAAPAPVVYIAGMDAACREKAFEIAAALRRAGVPCEVDHMERSLKAQFKYADKLQAKYTAVIGGNELQEGVMDVKNMSDSSRERVPFADAVGYFAEK